MGVWLSWLERQSHNIMIPHLEASEGPEFDPRYPQTSTSNVLDSNSTERIIITSQFCILQLHAHEAVHEQVTTSAQLCKLLSMLGNVAALTSLQKARSLLLLRQAHCTYVCTPQYCT